MGHLPLLMQPVIRYVLSNGKKFDGKYDRGNKKFSGLHPMCDILGLNDFGCFNMFLFAFKETGNIKVFAFEDSFVEQILPGTPLSTGTIYDNLVMHVLECTHVLFCQCLVLHVIFWQWIN